MNGKYTLQRKISNIKNLIGLAKNYDLEDLYVELSVIYVQTVMYHDIYKMEMLSIFDNLKSF
jgi:hypothetical protein